jgi:hypothetical protein
MVAPATSTDESPALRPIAPAHPFQDISEESMPSCIQTRAVEIEISEASQLQECISKAVNDLMQFAIKDRSGILVTRHTFSYFIATIDPRVPCGETREHSR